MTVALGLKFPFISGGVYSREWCLQHPGKVFQLSQTYQEPCPARQVHRYVVDGPKSNEIKES